MEGQTVDPEHEDRAHLVMSGAERQLGEDRFGGAWIDRTTPSRPVIGVAAVDPSQGDVDAIDAVRGRRGGRFRSLPSATRALSSSAFSKASTRRPLPATRGSAWGGTRGSTRSEPNSGVGTKRRSPGRVGGSPTMR